MSVCRRSFLGDRVHRILGLFLAAAAALATVAPAQAQPAAARMPLGHPTAPPAGYVEFCLTRPGECLEQVGRTPPGVSPFSTFWREAFRDDETSSLAVDAPAAGEAAHGQVAVTSANLELLNTVNRAVNGAIAPMADQAGGRKADIWSLPLAEGAGRGDCEDYVLEKRRALMARGLPPEALSIAVVRTRLGESHAVLVVDTDLGELVLDNRSTRISRWADVDYRWVKRQSRLDPAVWVRVGAL